MVTLRCHDCHVPRESGDIGFWRGTPMITRIRTSLRHDEGASAVEYGLLVAAIAAVIVGVVFLLGSKVSATFSKTCSGINSGSC